MSSAGLLVSILFAIYGPSPGFPTYSLDTSPLFVVVIHTKRTGGSAQIYETLASDFALSHFDGMLVSAEAAIGAAAATPGHYQGVARHQERCWSDEPDRPTTVRRTNRGFEQK